MYASPGSARFSARRAAAARAAHFVQIFFGSSVMETWCLCHSVSWVTCYYLSCSLLMGSEHSVLVCLRPLYGTWEFISLAHCCWFTNTQVLGFVSFSSNHWEEQPPGLTPIVFSHSTPLHAFCCTIHKNTTHKTFTDLSMRQKFNWMN